MLSCLWIEVKPLFGTIKASNSTTFQLFSRFARQEKAMFAMPCKAQPSTMYPISVHGAPENPMTGTLFSTCESSFINFVSYLDHYSGYQWKPGHATRLEKCMAVSFARSLLTCPEDCIENIAQGLLPCNHVSKFNRRKGCWLLGSNQMTV